MIVFTSYVRRDHNLVTLRRIKSLVAVLGQPYIDDLHEHGRTDRTVTVECALWAAGAFVAVFTPGYLQTPWTRWEFKIASMRQIPFYVLMSDSVLIERVPDPLRWAVAHYAELETIGQVSLSPPAFTL